MRPGSGLSGRHRPHSVTGLALRSPRVNQLSNDADGNLIRIIGADGQPDRCVNAIELLVRYPLCRQFLPHQGNLPATPDHPDICSFRPDRLPDNRLVVLMPACDRTEIRQIIDLEFFEG